MAEVVITEAEAPGWQQWVTDFDKTWQLFNDNYNGLMAQEQYIRTSHPELLDKFLELKADAIKHKATLDDLKATRDRVKNWLGKLGEALTPAPNTPWWAVPVLMGYDSGLGIAPVVVVVSLATAAVALAAIGKWIKDAYQFSVRLNELHRLEDQGYSTAQAASMVNKSLGDPNNPLFGLNLKWVVLAGIAIVVVPYVLKRIRKK